MEWRTNCKAIGTVLKFLKRSRKGRGQPFVWPRGLVEHVYSMLLLPIPISREPFHFFRQGAGGSPTRFFIHFRKTSLHVFKLEPHSVCFECQILHWNWERFFQRLFFDNEFIDLLSYQKFGTKDRISTFRFDLFYTVVFSFDVDF